MKSHSTCRAVIGCVALGIGSSMGFPGAHAAEDWRTAKTVWPNPLLKEGALKKVSEHVHVIPDGGIPAVANIGIIVGDRAILVIDTSVGRRNGEIILREVGKLGKRDQLLLTATHFHPDHTTGAAAFPANTTIILNDAVLADIRDFGASMVADFTRVSPFFANLLKDSPYPQATVSFDQECEIHLGGGVSVKAIAMGANHTRGDTVFLVEPDNVLFTGDVVMEGAPQIASPYSRISHWLESLDRIQAMKPKLLVPDHGPLGNLTLVDRYRAYFTRITERAAHLRKEGKTADETVEIVRTELRPTFEDSEYRGVWSWDARMSGSVLEAYKEAAPTQSP
jgi:glyoxylase-like metal-dependent hydrolase (beta-lactamase superfamily II)